MLNLSIWFALHTLFGTVAEHHQLGMRQFGMRLLAPDWFTLDVAAVLIAAGAFGAIFVFKRGMIVTLVVSAIVGMAAHLVIGSGG